MDAMLRGKAEELAKEIAVSISTQQELSDVMRLMTKSVIERMLDAEMDVHLDQERGRTVPEAVATTAAMPTATTVRLPPRPTPIGQAKAPAAIAATASRPRPCRANRDG